jgi:hypothetical protein
MKVRFSEENRYFSHPADKELDLRKYRSPFSVAWPFSHQLRFEQTLNPILTKESRKEVDTRNLLAEVAYKLSQIHT